MTRTNRPSSRTSSCCEQRGEGGPVLGVSAGKRTGDRKVVVRVSWFARFVAALVCLPLPCASAHHDFVNKTLTLVLNETLDLCVVESDTGPTRAPLIHRTLLRHGVSFDARPGDAASGVLSPGVFLNARCGSTALPGRVLEHAAANSSDAFTGLGCKAACTWLGLPVLEWSMVDDFWEKPLKVISDLFGFPHMWEPLQLVWTLSLGLNGILLDLGPIGRAKSVSVSGLHFGLLLLGLFPGWLGLRFWGSADHAVSLWFLPLGWLGPSFLLSWIGRCLCRFLSSRCSRASLYGCFVLSLLCGWAWLFPCCPWSPDPLVPLLRLGVLCVVACCLPVAPPLPAHVVLGGDISWRDLVAFGTLGAWFCFPASAPWASSCPWVHCVWWLGLLLTALLCPVASLPLTVGGPSRVNRQGKRVPQRFALSARRVGRKRCSQIKRTRYRTFQLHVLQLRGRKKWARAVAQTRRKGLSSQGLLLQAHMNLHSIDADQNIQSRNVADASGKHELSQYEQWLKQNHDQLAGGAAASARNLRKRKQQQQQSTQMSSLVQTFKRFLNQSPDADLGPIHNLLQSFQASSAPKKKRKNRPKPAPTQPEPKIEIWKGQRYQVCPRTGWWTKLETSRPTAPQNPSGNAKSPLSKTWPTPAQSAASQRAKNAQQGSPNLSSPVTTVRALDWNPRCAPKLTRVADLIQALQIGAPLPGNLAEITNDQALTEIGDVWKAYSDPGPLTLMLTGSAKHPLQHQARVSLGRGHQRLRSESIGLLTVGARQGPWVPETQTITKVSMPAFDRIQVRILAPRNYRQAFLPDAQTEDTAACILATLASAAGISTGPLLGGHWLRRNKGDSEHLVGYLKLKPDIVEALEKVSGNKAIFVNRVQSRTETRPCWIRKEPNESREGYFRRVATIQSERKQNILWRQGGGNDLGFPALSSDEVLNTKKILSIHGIPKQWTAVDVEDLFHNIGWTQFSTSSFRRGTWYASGTPPPRTVSQSCWEYMVEGEAWRVTALVLPPKPKGPVVSKPVRSPQNTKADRTAAPASGSANTEATTREQTRGRSRARTADQQEQRDRSRSGRAASQASHEEDEAEDMDTGVIDLETPQAPPLDPQEAMAQGWTELDFHGNGDCLFRSVAAFLMKAESCSSEINDESTAARGIKLRIKAVKWIRKNEKRFSALWTPKAGCAQTWAQWLDVASLQTTWGNGSFLQSLSETLGCPLIVWHQTNTQWNRYTVAGRFGSNGLACKSKTGHFICLILRKQHYTLLLPPDNIWVPTSWLGESVTSVELDGGAKSECSEGIPPRSSCQSSSSAHSLYSTTSQTLETGAFRPHGAMTTAASAPVAPDAALSRSSATSSVDALSVYTPSIRSQVLPCPSLTGNVIRRRLVSKSPAVSLPPSVHSVPGSTSALACPDLAAPPSVHGSCSAQSGANSTHCPLGLPRKRLRGKSLCSEAFAACSCQGQASLPHSAVSLPPPSLHTVKSRQQPAVSGRNGAKDSSESKAKKAKVTGRGRQQQVQTSEQKPNFRSLEEDREIDIPQFRPDVAPYPRQKAAKRPAPPVGQLDIQGEQTWVCPLCEVEIYEKPGPRARKLFQSKRWNHLITRHTAEERRQVPRFGAATQLIVPSEQIPEDERAWSCPECNKGLPTLPKHWHESSVREHFRLEHPDTNPKEAYHNKQRRNTKLRKRMSSRGRHVGSLKSAAAIANLESWAAETDHVLSYIKIFHDPSREKRGLFTQHCLACSRCRRKGNPVVFKKTPCSLETKPIHTKLAAWMRRLVATNAENGPALQKGFSLSRKELEDLHLDENGHLCEGVEVSLDQGKFASTLEAAKRAGHDAVLVQPLNVCQNPNSTAKKQASGWVTCKKCWKVNPCGAVKLWSAQCQPPEGRSKAAQARCWRTLTKKQHNALAKAWEVPVSEAKVFFAKGPRRTRRTKRLDPKDGVRIGEASHPGPRRTKAQALRQTQKLWTCNTGGAPKTWKLLSHIKSDQPSVALLQEVAWEAREWAAFNKAAAAAGYNAYFSGTPNNARRGGSAVLVRRRLPSRPAWNFASDGGAAQVGWGGGYLIGSVYLAPNFDFVDACNEITAHLLALAPQDAWLIGGDFNAEPGENPFCHTLDDLGCVLSYPNTPTRWEGRRCIDYFIGNDTWSGPVALDLEVADHKIVQAHGVLRVPHVTAWKLAPVARLPTLTQMNITKDQWSQKADQVWGRRSHLVPWNSDVSQNWSDLSQSIFAALLETAQEVAPQTVASIPAGMRRRGRPAEPRFIQDNWNGRTPAGDHATCQEVKLTRHLARLQEVVRLTGLDQTVPNALWVKIHRSPYFDPNQTTHRNILAARKKLSECVRASQKSNLDKWKDAMQDDKAAFAWLRREPQVVSHALKSSPDDVAAASVSEALVKIKRFWRNIWDRQLPDPDETWSAIEDSLGPARPPEVWPALTGQDLCAAANAIKGRAAGIDQWTHNDMTLLSPGMWEQVASFVNHCENIGSIPRQWSHIRQLHLDKGKQSDLVACFSEASRARLSLLLRSGDALLVYFPPELGCCFAAALLRPWDASKSTLY
eukprot:Skav221162  [mRNA]  locus=scaffold85:207301:216528:+ [translate_table: standard]